MRRTLTESNWRELARTTKVNRVRPDPPMGVRYDAVSGVLSWEPPVRMDNVTHFRIYADNEDTLVREISAGQTQIADLMTAENVIVTSYNARFGVESSPSVLLGANVAPPPSPSVSDLSVTLDGDVVTY